MEVDAAASPGRAAQDRADGLLQPGVGLRDDQLDSGPAAGLQGAQERRPEGAVLAIADVQAEDFPAAVGGDPGGDDDRAADDPPIHPGLEVGGVQEQVREGCMGQRPGSEGRDLSVQLDTDPADLGLGDASVHAQALTRSSTLRVEVPCT
jgi:hypothetical protein